MTVPAGAARIVLVRHGETDFNVEDRWQGSRSDVPLNDTGRGQAAAVADRLAERYGSDLAAIYASDLARARETADILADRLELEVVEEPALRELDHGRWDGLLKSDIMRRFPEEYAAYQADPRDTRRGGGDSYVDLGERLWPALERLAGRHAGERIVAVSHGGPIRLVMSRVLDRPLTERDSFGVENASVFEVEYSSDAWTLIRPKV